MTARKFTSINGCTPQMVAPGQWVAIDENGVERASCKGVRDIKRALFIMSEELYRQNRLAALEQAKWKCVRCARQSNLSCHHKVHRGIAGTNRDDRVENLEVLCLYCHQKEHGG